MSDLLDNIDLSMTHCLNEKGKGSWGHAIKQGYREQDELFLESDADEQLILSIAFNQKSKINAIIIKGPADGSGPKSIKLYANRPSFGFSDVGTMPPSQEIELTESQLAGEAVSLKFVKFQSVVTLSIFVESNQGGEEVTKVSKVQIIGSTGEGDKFNVNEIKQVDKEQRNE